MKPDDSARRFTREEMQRILEMASEASPAIESAGSELGDLTLAEIKEIAEEVGIDPRQVEEASVIVLESGGLSRRVSLGTYQLERRLPRTLSPQEMRFMAQEGDSFFGAEGKIRETHGYLEWHNAEAGAFVGVVNEPEGARIRLIMDRGNQFIVGAVAIGAVGIGSIVVVLSQGVGVGGVVGSIGIGAGTLGLIREFWRRRKKGLLERLDSLLQLMTSGPASRGRVGDGR